jgi:peptidoglycan/LPS O-acetylase OafA/YrhL
MQSVGSALDEQRRFAQGFDFLRIFLATGIIGWHTANLSGHSEMAKASIFWLSEYMLVPMFFALSGVSRSRKQHAPLDEKLRVES